MFKPSRHARILALGTALVWGMANAFAAEVLDQEYIPNQLDEGGLEVTANQSDAQTFTVGVTGTLTKIDLIVNHHRCVATENLIVEISSTAGGLPAPPVLASVSLPPSAIPFFFSPGTITVDLSAFAIHVEAGEVLAIILRTAAPSSGCTYAWDGDTFGEDYAGGDNYVSHNGGPWFFASRDMGFRTYVEDTLDGDRDGVPDEDDECPDSDLSATVVVGRCDSGVSNDLLPTGCTLSDLMGDCANGARNHGYFVSCSVQLLGDLRKMGVITADEQKRIRKCVAHARVP